MTGQQTSYVQGLANITSLYERVEGAITRRIRDAETDRASLERAINKALRDGDLKRAQEVLQPYADKYLKGPVPAPRPEVDTSVGRRIVKYDEALPRYVAEHPKDSYAKQELKDYMRTQIPKGRRVNSALIALEIKKLGYKSVGDNYVKRQRKTKKR